MQNLIICVLFGFTVAVSGYGEGKADYDKMCSLVTNQLISLRHTGMKMSCLSAIKTQTGANDSEIANCLSAYIRETFAEI